LIKVVLGMVKFSVFFQPGMTTSSLQSLLRTGCESDCPVAVPYHDNQSAMKKPCGQGVWTISRQGLGIEATANGRSFLATTPHLFPLPRAMQSPKSDGRACVITGPLLPTDVTK